MALIATLKHLASYIFIKDFIALFSVAKLIEHQPVN